MRHGTEMAWLGIKRTLALMVCVLVLGASEAYPETKASLDILTISASTHEQMKELIERDKFAEDLDTFYPGVSDKAQARILNRAMNASLVIVMSVAKEKKSRSAVLDYIRIFLERTRGLELDSEEEKRVCWCYDQACEILGIDNADGMLENWLHGMGSAE